MKTFLSNSLTSIILKCLFFIIILFVIILSVINPIHWSIISIIIIVFITSFIFLFNSMFGFLKISENTIYIPNDLTFKNSRIQHKETINIDDIIAIEFLEEECTSNGSKIPWRYTGMLSYLKLIMKDESIKRIYLGKYSHKTWIKIEKLIINNRDILVLKDANSFVKLKKTGVL
ncbi:MAG: hypothetical protein IJZ77_05505 [Bacilli bacterium]|nr:hypothetical protein [Bacilli bacterium]